MERLPSDALANIMMRIPAKLLGQVRCVSKHLNHFLSQPSFIKFHMNRSIKIHDEILMFLLSSSTIPDMEGSVSARYARSLDEELSNFLNLPSCVLEAEPEFLTFYGSVNGLICINYRPYEPELVAGPVIPDNTSSIFLIWNPSLPAISILPRCQFPLWEENIVTYVRFGYDSHANDYKIVKVRGHVSEGDVDEWLQVEVYSMRRGVWELIPQKCPPHIIKLIDQDWCCADGHDGHLHWLGIVKLGKKQVQTIVEFDLGAQTFSEIPLPPYSSKRIWDSVGVLKGELCLMSVVVRGGDRTQVRGVGGDKCEVWVMKEYRNRSSWVQVNILSNLYGIGIGRPYGFTLSNKFLFAVPGDCTYRLYDPSTREVKIVVREDRDFRVIRYVNSLAWIAPPRP